MQQELVSHSTVTEEMTTSWQWAMQIKNTSWKTGLFLSQMAKGMLDDKKICY